MKIHTLHITSAAVLSLMMTACGGNENSDNNNTSENGSKFTKTAEWSIDNNKQGSTCFDFDTNAETDCTSTTWDIKHTKKDNFTTLWSNSGASGLGNGGVFGLRDWSELKKFTNATIMPGSEHNISRYYQADKTSGIFSNNKWYEYALNGGHGIFPNYNVYLINTDNSNKGVLGTAQLPVFAMQVVNYYKESDSGHPTIRWIDTTTPSGIKTKTIDASKDWAYVNLDGNGTVVTKEDPWHVAFSRVDIKVNGGDSGTGSVSAFLAKKPAGFYDDTGKAIKEKFIADQLEATKIDLTDTTAYQTTDEIEWVSDVFSSSLTPEFTGTYPDLDFGWYTYSGVTHTLTTKSEVEAKGAIIRSGEGNSYARMRLAEIKDGTWIFKFEVQPAS